MSAARSLSCPVRAISSLRYAPAAGHGGSTGRSLPLKENHDLRGADGPDTRHREAADDPPALGRIAVEQVLQVLWTELTGPPAVFLRQHLIFHELSTSLKRPANGDFYGIPTRTRANVKHQLTGECQASPGTRQRTRSNWQKPESNNETTPYAASGSARLPQLGCPNA